MAKRARSEGTIYRDQNGVWWAQLSPGPDGRRPRRKAATQAEALQLLRQMQAERAAGRDLLRRAETIRALIDDYLAAVEPQIRESTLINYRALADHITRRMGATKIDQLTVEGVQRLANALTRADLGPSRVRAVLRILRAAYDRVVPERVARNPVDWRRLRLIKADDVERRPIDEATLRTLLLAADDTAARGGDSRYAITWWLAIHLGLRRGEICALSWFDIDWSRSELRIWQQFAPGIDGAVLGPPKTAAGKRVLPIGPRLWARLQAEQELQRRERAIRGHAWNAQQFVLCRDDGRPVSPNALGNVLNRLCRQSGIQVHIHPHLLRHTVASLISDEGFSEAVIGSILGHDKPSGVTWRYTHATERAKRAAVEAVEARIWGQAESASESRQPG